MSKRRLQMTNEENLVKLIGNWHYALEIAKVERADISEKLVDCDDEITYIKERIREAKERLAWVRRRKGVKGWDNL